MDHTFTDEQRAIGETAARFARERLAPGYREREKQKDIGRDLVRDMGALGLIGADLPQACGGLGQSSVTAGIVIEAVAAGDINVSYVQLLSSLTGQIIAANAGADLARHWIERMVAGECLMGLALTEPKTGSDAANLALKAERSGNSYVLSGEKTSMSLSTSADAAVVFARTGDRQDGARGVSAFLVDLDDSAISRTRFDDMGTRAVSRGSVFFDGVRVPAENRLGEEGQGFGQVMRGFDYSRALIGLQCLAAARASLEETWSYVCERQAFGGPLAEYQGVTFPLAEAETHLTMARQLCYLTLDLRDRGLEHTKEAAMVKWFAPKTSVDVIHQCLLTHGHYGYTTDLPHEQRMRDVVGLEIGDGTAQIMKLVIAREKIGRVAVQYAHRSR